jgi:hypothetical protein
MSITMGYALKGQEPDLLYGYVIELAPARRPSLMPMPMPTGGRTRKFLNTESRRAHTTHGGATRLEMMMITTMMITMTALLLLLLLMMMLPVVVVVTVLPAESSFEGAGNGTTSPRTSCQHAGAGEGKAGGGR